MIERRHETVSHRQRAGQFERRAHTNFQRAPNARQARIAKIVASRHMQGRHCNQRRYLRHENCICMPLCTVLEMRRRHGKKRNQRNRMMQSHDAHCRRAMLKSKPRMFKAPSSASRQALMRGVRANRSFGSTDGVNGPYCVAPERQNAALNNRRVGHGRVTSIPAPRAKPVSDPALTTVLIRASRYNDALAIHQAYDSDA